MTFLAAAKAKYKFDESDGGLSSDSDSSPQPVATEAKEKSAEPNLDLSSNLYLALAAAKNVMKWYLIFSGVTTVQLMRHGNEEISDQKKINQFTKPGHKIVFDVR